MNTKREGSGYGSALRTTLSRTLKIAALAPIPRARMQMHMSA